MSAHESPGTILRRYGLHPKKAWGQNFLGDESVQERIAALAEANDGETIVELGAGLGHLTRHLVEGAARVVAVERDRELAPILRTELGDRANVEIVEADAVTFDFAQLAQSRGRLVVCGNLPYHLGSPILFHLLDQRAAVRRFVLMLQREVVERIVAAPGSRDYGLLSVLLQQAAELRLALQVPRGAFVPPPEIDSAVLVGTMLDAPRAKVDSDEHFRKLVKAAFAQRRKTLRNSLAAFAGKSTLDAAAAEAGIDLARRAETLSVDEFALLERALARHGG